MDIKHTDERQINGKLVDAVERSLRTTLSNTRYITQAILRPASNGNIHEPM